MALPRLPKSLDKQRRELTKFWLRFRTPVIGAGVAIVLLLVSTLAWDTWQRSEAEARQHRNEANARWVAEDVQRALDAMVAAADAALDISALAALVAAGDEADMRARETALRDAVPGALGVRLLRSVMREPNYGASPPITYASIEMMRVASDGTAPPPPEVLLQGGKEQHVALLRALRSEDGTVEGFVLFGLDVKPIIEAVTGAGLTSGYAELAQRGTVGIKAIARKGDAAFRQADPAATLPIRGSKLRVYFWPERDLADVAGGALPLPLLAGALLLAAGGAFWYLRRRRQAGTALERAAPGHSELDQKLAALASGGGGASVPADSGIEVDEEQAMAPADLSDAIFRAYDVRGVVGETLTTDVVNKIGMAIGSEAYDRGQQTLCVGCDGRESSPEMVAALVAGLRASGRDVIDVGRVPTPVLYFATYYLETGSGVMVTGSHNPPQYNGLKIMIGGDTLFGEDSAAWRHHILEDDFTNGAGNLQSMDIAADYIRRVSEDVPVALGNAFKVVIDCGNGIAGDLAPKLIRALGHDVVELFCEVDGSFPNHHPDPSQPENLADLIAAVREHGADLGFAFDGDGDRLGVVDGSGTILWPDSQMMLFARDVLSRNAGAEIVFDVKCSSRLAKVIAKMGGKPVMFKTGHSYIKNKLKETGAPLAGEMSGHIFFKERWYGFDDALYAAARMLEILMGFKQTPAEVFAKLPVGVSTPELRVDMEEGENLSFMASLADTKRFADAKVTTIDGVRVDWDNRWGLVRASNTTPSLVLRFEGDDEQALEQVKEAFRTLLLEKRPDLVLPF